MRKAIALIVLIICGLSNTRAMNEGKGKTLDDWKEAVSAWLANYSRPDCSLRPSKLTNIVVSDSMKAVVVEISGGFAEQFFTPIITDTIYSRIRSMLPVEAKDYDLTIAANNHPIEYYIPNFFRKGRMDMSRLPEMVYRGEPWTRNASRPYRATRGLEGRHIALWASHGRYVDHKKKEWAWQRPRLYCTTEDLLSQTIVVPYIIPMLENAGGVVYTPRERDWQTNEVVQDIKPFPNLKAILASDTLTFLKEVRDRPYLWRPYIPETGRYAVYVNYTTVENSARDARYTVYHKGGMTEFRVNQQMGGGTWVYLGSFDFDKGENDHGRVTLDSNSEHGGVVTAGAVRFGGGMGNVMPAIAIGDTTNVKKAGTVVLNQVSGMPRWAECAKYSAVWYGLPYSKHTEPFGDNDYNNDINIRSAAVNYLMGQSVYLPDRDMGLRVPLDLTVAFHTDAGATRDDSYIGSLGIYRTDFNDGKTGAGLNRFVSRDLSSIILTNLTTDLKKYNWKVRQLRDANYGECREPMTPVCILEMLSHQNFADMRMAYNPHFKFDFARSVYKSIVKFLATQYGKPYVIQPLPVTNFRIHLDNDRSEAILEWEGQEDPTETTAKPTSYIVYTRIGNQSFDNGTLVRGTKCTVNMDADKVYSFRVTAVNDGGESFPSETLAAGIATNSKSTVMVVNAFTRLEGPAEVNTPTECGFDIYADPGVPYGQFNGFCGAQKVFARSKIGRETDDGLGMSGSELECKMMMGNTFDYPAIHGEGIMKEGKCSFVSCSEQSVIEKKVKLSDYGAVDVIYGVQKAFSPITTQLLTDYMAQGGKVVVSAANSGAPCWSGAETARLTDTSINTIRGCGLEFDIYREMNEQSYCVPATTVLSAHQPAFPILTYANGSYAAIAQPKRFVRLGFPLEAIKDRNKMQQLIGAFIRFVDPL